MFISGGNDTISCKMVVGTLAEVALKRFKGLPECSVTNFEDIASRFVQQFSANKNAEVGLGGLFDVRQGPSDSLKNYLDRFNKTTVLVEVPDENFFVTAFIKGLRSSTFIEALIILKPRTMEKVWVRAEKHIEDKDSSAGKQEKERGRQGPFIEWSEPQRAQPNQGRDKGNRSRNWSGRPGVEEASTPLNANPPAILDNSLHDGTIRRGTKL